MGKGQAAQLLELRKILADISVATANALDKLDARINVLYDQLAEQNIRVLFILHSIRVKRLNKGIVTADHPAEQMISGYQHYIEERDNFMAKLEADMQIAEAALRKAEADGKTSPDAQSPAPDSGAGDQQSEPGAHDSARPATQVGRGTPGQLAQFPARHAG